MDVARQNSLADLLRRSAAKHPRRTALIQGERRYDYAGLDHEVNRAARALADRGVAKGDRIALLSRNNLDFVVLYFALARLGAISVPINFMLTAEEVAFILGHSGATGLLAQDALLPVADAAAGAAVTLRGAIATGADVAHPAGWQDWNDWLTEAADPPQVEIEDDDPIQIMYTSGTESRPKGAIMTSRSLIAQYASCVIEGEMSGDDVEAHALPLYHCAQLHCFLTPGLQLGATNIVLAGPDPAALLATIERDRVTKLFCPPTVWIGLLRHPDLATRDLSSLRKGYYGASIMPVEVLKELAARLPQVRLFNFYGQTEMAPLATILKPDEQLTRLGSAGRAALNVETRVVDEDDRPLPAGEIGEIVHRSPHLMLGYWNDPERTAAAFRGGWFHSGDLGVLDADGYLSVVDRKKDMIKTGGENVASREVEETIYRHPAVAEVAVFGVPDPRWIEAVTAAVVLRDGTSLTEEALIAFCREHLAPFKTPKRVVFLDALPKNASGKLLKRELRADLAS